MGLSDDKNAAANVISGDDVPKALRDAGVIAAIASQDALDALSEDELRRIAFLALKAIEDRRSDREAGRGHKE